MIQTAVADPTREIERKVPWGGTSGAKAIFFFESITLTHVKCGYCESVFFIFEF